MHFQNALGILAIPSRQQLVYGVVSLNILHHALFFRGIGLLIAIADILPLLFRQKILCRRLLLFFLFLLKNIHGKIILIGRFLRIRMLRHGRHLFLLCLMILLFQLE